MHKATMAMAAAAMLAAACPAEAAAQEAGPRQEPWVFQVLKGAKAVGRYDMMVVSGEGGVRATAVTYAGAAALGKKKPGRGDVRAHAELDAAGRLGKYKRWKSKGKSSALYWMAFVYEGQVKIRSEREDGKNARVAELGAAEAVFPLEADEPFLAWLLLRDRTEREVACVSTSSTVLGKARVARGAAGEGETWTVSGDCGTFTVRVDDHGEPAEFAGPERKWVRAAAPGG